MTRRHSTITGAPQLTANNEGRKEHTESLNNVSSATGNTKTIPYGSSDVLSEDKKQWPAPGNVLRHGSKSSQEREMDQKLLQNRATNRPVVLNIGGTKYEVFRKSYLIILIYKYKLLLKASDSI